MQLLNSATKVINFYVHSSGGNISCVVVFVCLYYFMVAGGLWVIILAYSLHTSFKSYGENTLYYDILQK